MKTTRRNFVLGALAGSAFSSSRNVAMAAETKDAPISATEDLMREHGVLDRILLIYEEGIRRLEGPGDVSPTVFSDSANLVRRFIGEYHNKLEEDFVFPAFSESRRHMHLVATLREQHRAGREVTEAILHTADPKRFHAKTSGKRIASLCRSFIRMLRPHEAFEDTVLFPAFQSIATPDRLAELGEQFEEREEMLFGEGGYHKIVAQVAEIEKKLGVHDLGQFTAESPTK